jgi:hypothetical protein
MKHTDDYVAGLEELITERLMPVYIRYHREKKIPIPGPDIHKEFSKLMKQNKCKLPKLFLPKEI